MKRITSEKQYEVALAEVERLMDAEEGTAEFEKLMSVATAVHAYEELHYTIEPPPVAAAVQFRMDQQKLSQADVVRMTGISKSHLSEILSGSRPPSKESIRLLNDKLGIPLQHLLEEDSNASDPLLFASLKVSWDETDDMWNRYEDTLVAAGSAADDALALAA